tara:strand:- start:1049 stop:1279 length:231 start_codon:yes stop_codon:yes gene_type:complete
MTLFWISIAILYVIIVFILHKIFYKDVRGDEKLNKRLWKFWGVETGYWQGALLLGLGILALILAIAKWADILPNMN